MRINKKDIFFLKRKLRLSGEKGLALDIDDTLSLTIDYLVEEYFKKLGNPENLNSRELMKKYNHTNNVPYWQSEVKKEIIKNINNSAEFHRNLPLIKNADKTVQEINKTIPIVAYITARPTIISQATIFWLKKYNFPKATIIFRPKNIKSEDGSQWKAKILKYLYPEVIGIVDDNPGLVNFFDKKYKGIVYLYGGENIQKENINIVPCENWEVVAQKVKDCKIIDVRD